MKILICTATFAEVRPYAKALGYFGSDVTGIISGTLKKHEVDIFVTGIGMVNTAFNLGGYFVENRPDLAVNMGIAGSFDEEYLPGSVVEIVEDCFSEMGAEDGEDFLSLEKIGLVNFLQGKRKIYNCLTNPVPMSGTAPMVKGITVNTVHGNAQRIALAKQRWNPAVETMEGAAFFQACLLAEIPFFAFRGISNRVEVRNRASWQIKEAIEAVNSLVLDMTIEST